MSHSIRNYLLFVLSLPLAAEAATAAPGFTRPFKLVAKNATAVRELTISNWHVDKRGVPSFDYGYRQTGPGCNYQRDGHAEAGYGINGETVELEIYNAQDANGKDGEPIGIFHDEANGVVFSMPVLDKAPASWASFRDPRMSKMLGAKCNFSRRDDTVMLRK
jgi:hypothetical protein